MRYGQGVPTIAHALSRALRGEGENFLLIAYDPNLYAVVGTLEEGGSEDPPPSSVADFFHRPVFRHHPPDMVFCLNLRQLGGIFDEDLPG